MTSRELTGLLKNAVILAENLEYDRVAHTRQYLHNNGVHASEAQVIQLLTRKWVPLFSKTEEAELIEIANAIDKLCGPQETDVQALIKKYDWTELANYFIGDAVVTVEELANVLQDVYDQGCDDAMEVSNEFHEDN